MNVRIFPGLIELLSKKNHHLPEVAIWLISRSLDSDGTGIINTIDIKNICLNELNWSRGKFLNSIKNATKLNIINIKNNPNGKYKGKWIIYISTEKFCKIFNIQVGKYFLEVPIEHFKTVPAIKAIIYSSFIAGTKSLISRKTIEEITGISNSTQQRYQKRSKILTSKKNILETKFKPNQLGVAIETQHPNCYIMNEKVYRPLPNNYNCLLEKVGKRTAQKISSNLFFTHDGHKKIFFTSDKSCKKYLKKNDTARNLLYPKENLGFVQVWQCY